MIRGRQIDTLRQIIPPQNFVSPELSADFMHIIPESGSIFSVIDFNIGEQIRMTDTQPLRKPGSHIESSGKSSPKRGWSLSYSTVPSWAGNPPSRSYSILGLSPNGSLRCDQNWTSGTSLSVEDDEGWAFRFTSSNFLAARWPARTPPARTPASLNPFFTASLSEGHTCNGQGGLGSTASSIPTSCVEIDPFLNFVLRHPPCLAGSKVSKATVEHLGHSKVDPKQAKCDIIPHGTQRLKDPFLLHMEHIPRACESSSKWRPDS